MAWINYHEAVALSWDEISKAWGATAGMHEKSCSFDQTKFDEMMRRAVAARDKAQSYRDVPTDAVSWIG